MKRRVRALPVWLIGVFAVVATSTGMAPALAGADTVAPARTPKANAAVGASVHSTRSTKSPATSDPASILQISAVDGSATSRVPRVEVALDPGASTQRSFAVTNHSATLRLTVALEAVDATAQPNGDMRYASTASNDGPASWVTLSDLVETLEPGASTRVQVTVAPPADALPGAVVAGVVARVDQAARADNGSVVPADASASLPISIKVNGAPTALVSISSVGAVKDHGHEFLAITFQNSGATANTMVGQVQVSGTGGHTYPIHIAVAPLKRTTMRLPFTMPPGAKTAPVSVATEDGAGDQASWSGPVGFALPPAASSSPSPKSSAHSASASIASHAASLPRPALILIGLALVLAAIWFVAELRRNRSRRRSTAMVPAMAGAFATYAFGTSDPLGAVVSQLGSLVEAIDRLVSGLGTGQSTVEITPSASVVAPAPRPAPARSAAPAPTATPAPSPAPAAAPAPTPTPTSAPAPAVTPVAKSPATELAELATLLSLPAAASVPEFDESDPYSWPTQEQLDQFADRRRESQDNPE